MSDDAWKAKVQELVKVVEELGHFPKSKEEMGGFLQAQRLVSKGVRRGEWNPEREAYINEHLPEWRGGHAEEKWRENVQKLIIVVEKLGHLPKRNEPMGIFLTVQRQAAKGKDQHKWTAERQEYMDTHFSGWLSRPYDETWLENAEKLKAIHKSLGRLPKEKEEMGRWLDTQRSSAKGKGNYKWTSERESYMNANFPGWLINPYDEAWLENAEKLKVIQKRLERLPKTREEMGKWLDKQRLASKGKGAYKWTPEREAYMNANFPGWKDNYLSTIERNWQNKVQELLKVVEKLGRLPKINEEMGKWLAVQRSAANGRSAYKWTAEREAYLDEHLPGWKGDI